MQKTLIVGGMMFAALATTALSGCSRPASAGPRPDVQAALDIRKRLEGNVVEASSDSAAPAAAAESTATGWATLKGTFKFVGNPPAPRQLNVDKDTEVCGKGMGIQDNSLLVASDRGIANIVLYAKAKRVHDSAKPLAEGNSAEPIVFDPKLCMFLTHVLGCQVNQKIDVKNSDPVGHNTKIDPAKGVPFNQNLPSGNSVAYSPSDEEALPATVSCSIHPWMRGYLMPRKDKYFAVTKPDGSFEITNLPAGEEIEVQVWHERGTGAGGALVLANKDLKWTNKGRFKIKLDADQTKDLALEVPETAFK